MFKRKLFKRALPFILSVAMMFESLPATAMATESSGAEQMTETERQSEEGGEERSGSGSEESAEAASTEERLSEESSGSESGSESEEAPTSEEASGSESGSESEASTPSGSETPSTSEEWSESGSESETPSTSEESSGSEHEDEREEIEQKEVDAEETVNKKYETEIKIAEDLCVEGGTHSVSNFVRVLEGEGEDYKFSAKYRDPSQCGELEKELKNSITIMVDGDKVEKDPLNNSITERLSFEWKTKKADSTATGAEAYTESVSPAPVGVGDYMLTITLPEIAELCQKRSINVFVRIDEADITLELSASTGESLTVVKPGTTVAEFKEQITNGYKLRYDENKAEDLYIDKDAVKEFRVDVHESNAEESEILADDIAFSTQKDYFAHITIVMKDEKCYKVKVEDFYKVTVGDLQPTRVDVTLDKEAYSKIYDGAPVDPATLIKAESKVYIIDAAGEDVKELTPTDASTPLAELGWYRRIKEEGNPSATEITDTTVKYADTVNQKDWKYIKLDEAPTDAGDYFAIWKYAGGDQTAYMPSVSEPVSVVVEPAPVVITIANDEAGLNTLFCEGMSADDIRNALALIEYKVSTVNAEGAVDEASDIKTDNFFGTGYIGDGEADTATGNYKPVFELQRRTKAKMENGSMTAIEEKEEDWKNVLTNFDSDKFVLKDDDHEYEYRVIFNTNKALYYKGRPVKEEPITQLSSDSADRNHLAKTDIETRAKYAKKVNIVAAKQAEIDVKAIVDEFNSKTNSKVVGDGSLEKPATKIYDENALFTDRASYKKATVKEKGTSTVVSDGKLTYSWSKARLCDYEDYMEETDAQREKSPFTERNKLQYLGTSTNVEDGNLWGETANSALYELTVHYEDKTNTYRAEDAKVYFVVEQQQIVIVPGTPQMAQDGQRISNWLYGDAGNATVDKSLYKVYKLPNNDRAEFDKTADKSAYEMESLHDRYDWVYDYDDDGNHLLDENGDWVWHFIGYYQGAAISGSQFDFIVMNKEKTADGKDKDNYVDTEHSAFSKSEYSYGVTARYLDGVNYTSVDKANSTAKETKYHDMPSEITFLGNGRLYVSIDKAAIKNLKKTYDGEAITLPEGAIKLYSDKEMTEAHNVTGNLLNADVTTYDPEKVNIFWRETNTGKYYTTNNVVWGGDYALVLRFKGNDDYKPLAVNYEDDKDWGETYDEWCPYDYDEYGFSIQKRSITLTPELKAESDIKAGDTVDTLLQKKIAVGGDILEKDRAYFEEYREHSKELLETYWKQDENGIWYEYNVSNHENEWLNTKHDGAYSYDLDAKGGFPAFNGMPNFIFQMDDKSVITAANKQYLRYGKKYTVNFATEATLHSVFGRSYEATYLSASQSVVNRGQAEVVSTASGDVREVSLRYDYDGKTYSIRPLAAIPYVDKLEGNYIAYKIYAPKEFEGDVNGAKFEDSAKGFVFNKSIEQVGGIVVEKIKDGELLWPVEETVFPDDATGDNMGIDVISDHHYITVLLPVTEDDKERSFDITWEDGYTDTFKLVNAELEADLREAVAPKSISFNGVQTKMAVGETQQLDVKITKAQLGDVIKVQYRIAGTTDQTKNEFISIDPDTGVVTALHTAKKATTQIEAYPVYRDKTGKLVEITGKKVKKAKTKITVTNVSAPSIKKILMKDVTADVQFTDAGNGYRREIYVVEKDKSAAKRFKAADFEAMISSVKNGLYKDAGFALEPVYSYTTSDNNDSEEYNPKTKLITKQIGKRYDRDVTELTEQLTPGKTYVVYVRNVSTARTLDDGSTVDFAYNGTVKSFLATKSQAQELIPYFKVNDDNTPVAKSAVKYYVTGYKEDGSEKWSTGEYQVNLLDKTAQVSVDGLFWDFEGGNDAAENADKRQYALPLTKALQVNYLNPKLVYGICDDDNDNFVLDGGKFKDKVTGKNITSKYATINNKGKITLKGVGLDGEAWVRVLVGTTNSENTNMGSLRLCIKANPTTVTGKKAKLKVGETKPLSDFLEYKQGKKKVPNYISTQITIADDEIAKAAAAGYVIEDTIYYDDVRGENVHYWSITAVAPNKKAITLNVTDRTNDGTELRPIKPITLTASAIEPVKSLKTAYVDDENITINFKHNGDPQGYEIALLDARKNIVEKRFVDGMNYLTIPATADAYMQNYQSWKVDNFASDLVYFEKTKTFAYTISGPKVLRQSSYTVTVTPVYENQRPKTVSRKVKTTNIPAAREWNLAVLPDTARTGMEITYRVQGKSEELGVNDNNKFGDEISIIKNPYFQAGNVYTLRAQADDDAKNRVTDTLTWKSSNTKVATIKANTGKYTATLRPIKAGTTTITVTSKITKKVIAKFDIRVKAIGNGDGFGGNFEPAESDQDFFGQFLAVWDPYYAGRLEVLSATNPLTLKAQAYDRVWVSFTAPTFGEYTFDLAGASNVDVYDSKNNTTKMMTLTKTVDVNGEDVYDSIFLEGGQKIYFRLDYNTPGQKILRVNSSTTFARLTELNDAAKPLAVRANEWVAFTAPEDNYYSFITPVEKGTLIKPKFRKGNNEENEENATFKVNEGEKVKDDKGKVIAQRWDIGLKAGETIFIKTDAGKIWVDFKKTDAKTTIEIDSAKNSASVDLTNKDRTQFVKFTAPLTARYDFKTVIDDKNYVQVKFNEATFDNGNITYGGNANNIALLAADEATTEEKKEEKITSVYMRAGQTVIITFTIDNDEAFKKDGKVDDTKKYTETVTVTTPTIKDIVPGTEETVGKMVDKVATVASYKFKVPTAINVKYAFTNAQAVYYDSKGNELQISDNVYVDAESKVNGITFKTKADAKPNIKAGDTILIEVTNGTSEDIKYKITEIKPGKLEKAPVEIQTSDSNNEFWYTFTAPEAGVYEFKGVDETKENTAEQHTSEVTWSNQLFVNTNNNAKNTSKLMLANETIYIKVKVDPINKPTVTTKVTLSATLRPTTEITAVDTNVSLTSKGETYYKFIAPKSDTYTFKWALAEKDPGAGTVQICDSLKFATNVVDITSSSVNKDLAAGKVYYIKVSTTDKVNGVLTITGLRTEADELKSGAAGKFEIKANATKNFIFTAPTHKDEENYSITVTVEGEDTTYPTVTVKGETYSSFAKDANVEVIKLNAQSDTFMIAVTNTSAKDIKGEILMQPQVPAAEKLVNGTATVKTSIAKYAYYEYTIPEYGRYNFDVTPADNNNATCSMKMADKKNGGFVPVDSSTLLNKGDVVYITVKTGSVAEQTATLKVEKINPAALTADQETDVIISASGKYAYYMFTAPERASYDFHNYTPVEGKNSDVSIEVVKYETGDSVYSYTLDKDDKVFIRIKANADDVAVKYAVKKTTINEVKENQEKSATIKAENFNGEKFAFKVQNTGMYAFQITGEVNKPYMYDTLHDEATEKGYYIVKNFTRTNVWEEFTVYSKDTTKDTSVTVKVTKIEPIVLTADAAEVAKDIAKGECLYAEFIPTATARYTLTTSSDYVDITYLVWQDGHYEEIDGEEVWVPAGFDEHSNQLTDRIVKKNAADYGLIKFTVSNTSPEDHKSETVKAKVTTVKPSKEITTTESFKKPAVGAVWYTFKAPENAKYKFELTNAKSGDEEKPVNGNIWKYNDVNDDEHESLSEALMKAGETFIIKVDAEAEKDADVALKVTKTAVEDFKEANFHKATTGDTVTKNFAIKKGEEYTITVVPKGTASFDSVTATYSYKIKDTETEPVEDALFSQDGKNATYTINAVNFEEDTTVDVTVKMTAKEDADFYIFVEKKPKETTEQ